MKQREVDARREVKLICREYVCYELPVVLGVNAVMCRESNKTGAMCKASIGRPVSLPHTALFGGNHR